MQMDEEGRPFEKLEVEEKKQNPTSMYMYYILQKVLTPKVASHGLYYLI